MNVLNLKYGLLVHNSAKVVPLQVFGKFRLVLPYITQGAEAITTEDAIEDFDADATTKDADACSSRRGQGKWHC